MNIVCPKCFKDHPCKCELAEIFDRCQSTLYSQIIPDLDEEGIILVERAASPSTFTNPLSSLRKVLPDIAGDRAVHQAWLQSRMSKEEIDNHKDQLLKAQVRSLVKSLAGPLIEHEVFGKQDE